MAVQSHDRPRPRAGPRPPLASTPIGVGATPELSIVVPAYNERHRLDATLGALLDLAGPTTEVILVDDGSTDGTGDLLHQHAWGRPMVSTIRLPANRGKGAAVRAGVARAQGEAVAFMDADLATDVGGLPRLVGALATADIAIGSRSAAGAVVEDASQRRRRMGEVFNRLVRSSTGVPFRDTQCGFKAFRAGIGKVLFHLNELDGFAFDVEVLALAAEMGLAVTEVPVRWREVPGTHVRAVRDPLRMAYDVVTARNRRHIGVEVLTVPDTHGAPARTAAAIRQLVGPSRPVLAGRTAATVVLPFTTRSEALALRRSLGRALDVAEAHLAVDRLSSRELRPLVRARAEGGGVDRRHVHRRPVRRRSSVLAPSWPTPALPSSARAPA